MLSLLLYHIFKLIWGRTSVYSAPLRETRHLKTFSHARSLRSHEPQRTLRGNTFFYRYVRNIHPGKPANPAGKILAPAGAECVDKIELSHDFGHKYNSSFSVYSAPLREIRHLKTFPHMPIGGRTKQRKAMLSITF